MVRPVADEGQLRRIHELPYEQLRPQFRSQVEAFVKKARCEHGFEGHSIYTVCTDTDTSVTQVT